MREEPCGPQSVLLQQGCTGPNGRVHLVADHLPWLGSPLHTHVAPVPANGLAIAVFGLAAQSLPLASVVPTALPGCTLGVVPLATQRMPASAGVAQLTVQVPATMALLGVQMLHQAVPCGLSAGGGRGAVTASDTLRLRFGI